MAGDRPSLEQVYDIFASYLDFSSLRNAMCTARLEENLPPPTGHAPSTAVRDQHKHGSVPSNTPLPERNNGEAASAHSPEQINNGMRHTDVYRSGDSGFRIATAVHGSAKALSHGRVLVAVANDVGEAPLELAGNLAVLERLGFVSCYVRAPCYGMMSP
jgi:hypothetical protein